MDTLRHRLRAAACGILVLTVGFSQRIPAQVGGACAKDRVVSTLVGAALGAAAGAIPATVVHRHDQTSSHRIVALSISTGAFVGFIAAGRDRPCASLSDSLRLSDPVITGRSRHASQGAIVGAVIGAALGAVGGTLYNIGCERGSCTATHAGVILFSASEGAGVGGLLGGLIGWAWPIPR